MLFQMGTLFQVTDNDINPDGTFTFPKNITGIGIRAFADCQTLTEIIIPDRIIFIDNCAFLNCENLKKVVIPDSITSIGGGAFHNCYNLTEITIPNSVKIIGPITFANCFNLEKITLPYSITTIEGSAFINCEKLNIHKNVYKGFSPNLECRDYQFELGKWSKKVHFPRLCKRGYHFCTNLFEIFNYYSGVYDEDFIICICEPGNKIKTSDTSKCVTNTIKPIRKLTREEVIDIINGKKI